MNLVEKKYKPQFITLSIIFFCLLGPIIFYNKELFWKINAIGPSFLDLPMYILTSLADGIFIVIFVMILYPQAKSNTISTLVALIIISVLIQTIKTPLNLDRPPLAFYGSKKIFILGSKLTSYSFPSGHSAAIMAFVRFLISFTKKKYYSIFIVIGILTCLSRVYVGVHFPFDIWVGSFMGYFVASLCINFLSDISLRIYQKFGDSLFYVLQLLVIATAIYYSFFHHERYEAVDFLLFPLLGFLSLLAMYNIIKMYLRKKVSTLSL